MACLGQVAHVADVAQKVSRVAAVLAELPVRDHAGIPVIQRQQGCLAGSNTQQACSNRSGGRPQPGPGPRPPAVLQSSGGRGPLEGTLSPAEASQPGAL